MKTMHALWRRVNEPKFVSALHATVYAILAVVGLYALINRPGTVDYAIGQPAMYLLAGTLAVGGAIGAPTALYGTWWLERTAVSLVILASGVYLMIVVAIQITGDGSGNRWLQAGYIFSVLALHLVRWHRVRQRPYDPTRPPADNPVP